MITYTLSFRNILYVSVLNYSNRMKRCNNGLRSIYDAVSTLNKYTCQQGYIPNFFLMLLVWGFCVHRDERTGSFTDDTKGNYIQIRRGLTLQSDTGTAQERTEEGDGQSEFGFFQSQWAHVIGSTAPIYSLNVSATPQSPSSSSFTSEHTASTG